MNYELAKQLKDAGFPIKWKELGVGTDLFQFPMLSELIEACGYSFRLECRNNAEKWYATLLNASDKVFQATGDTPEEAVAKLWIALNKK